MKVATSTSKLARLRIGCAGWSLPARQAAHFDAGASALERYASRFSMVEINSSFYRPHQAKTYARWAASVPDEFRFSVKIPRAISHDAALHSAGGLLDAFLDGVHCLEDKLGVLLLQLPPSLVYDGRVAANFFRVLRRRSDCPLACEPRHPSWFTPAAEAMLRSHGVARVAADPARAADGGMPGGTTDWNYWRWHGRPRVYYSQYQDQDLQQLVERLDHAGGSRSWIVFDNTAHGHAVGDALKLQALLGVGSDA
ncbi:MULTISPECIES: DUF72 domain-containing protein [Stenotrophomonas]|uniref:DUF72 domain-containing protein n=1 Tax=Stenotrophomonas TaxID=40323 RepID=UPI00076FE25D|nr:MULTISPECIES: DUF72 domain-containing protein [Stenotrophomonas]AMJ55263.1 hypothetical protein AXG53_00415 [Stenotrophomonas sp. KCTC 12332]